MNIDPLHHTPQEHASSDASIDLSTPVLDAVSKAKHQRLFQRGVKWLGFGVLLMGLSFAINLLLFGSDPSITTIMYVMTSIGTGCIIKGLVDVLGF